MAGAGINPAEPTSHSKHKSRRLRDYKTKVKHAVRTINTRDAARTVHVKAHTRGKPRRHHRG